MNGPIMGHLFLSILTLHITLLFGQTRSACVKSTLIELGESSFRLPCNPKNSESNQTGHNVSSLPPKGEDQSHKNASWHFPKHVNTQSFKITENGDAVITKVEQSFTGQATCVVGTGSTKKTFTRHIIVYNTPRYRFHVEFSFDIKNCNDAADDTKHLVNLVEKAGCPQPAKCDKQIKSKCNGQTKLVISVTGKQFHITDKMLCGGNIACASNIEIGKAIRDMDGFLKDLEEAKTIKSDNQTIRFNDKDTTASIGIVCTEGYFYHKRFKLCFPCSPGSFLNTEKKKCLLCAVGTYQDQYGQSSCKDCKQDGSKCKNDSSYVTPSCEYKDVLDKQSPSSGYPKNAITSANHVKSLGTNFSTTAHTGNTTKKLEETDLTAIKLFLSKESEDIKHLLHLIQDVKKTSPEKVTQMKTQYDGLKKLMAEIAIEIQQAKGTKYKAIRKLFLRNAEKLYKIVLHRMEKMMIDIVQYLDHSLRTVTEAKGPRNGSIPLRPPNVKSLRHRFRRSVKDIEIAETLTILPNVNTPEKRLRLVKYTKVIHQLKAVHEKLKLVENRVTNAAFMTFQAKLPFFKEIDEIKQELFVPTTKLKTLKETASDKAYHTILKMDKFLEQIFQRLDQVDSAITALNVPTKKTSTIIDSEKKVVMLPKKNAHHQFLVNDGDANHHMKNRPDKVLVNDGSHKFSKMPGENNGQYLAGEDSSATSYVNDGDGFHKLKKKPGTVLVSQLNELSAKSSKDMPYLVVSDSGKEADKEVDDPAQADSSIVVQTRNDGKTESVAGNTDAQPIYTKTTQTKTWTQNIPVDGASNGASGPSNVKLQQQIWTQQTTNGQKAANSQKQRPDLKNLPRGQHNLGQGQAELSYTSHNVGVVTSAGGKEGLASGGRGPEKNKEQQGGAKTFVTVQKVGTPQAPNSQNNPHGSVKVSTQVSVSKNNKKMQNKDQIPFDHASEVNKNINAKGAGTKPSGQQQQSSASHHDVTQIEIIKQNGETEPAFVAIPGGNPRENTGLHPLDDLSDAELFEHNMEAEKMHIRVVISALAIAAIIAIVILIIVVICRSDCRPGAQNSSPRDTDTTTVKKYRSVDPYGRPVVYRVKRENSISSTEGGKYKPSQRRRSETRRRSGSITRSFTSKDSGKVRKYERNSSVDSVRSQSKLPIQQNDSKQLLADKKDVILRSSIKPKNRSEVARQSRRESYDSSRNKAVKEYPAKYPRESSRSRSSRKDSERRPSVSVKKQSAKESALNHDYPSKHKTERYKYADPQAVQHQIKNMENRRKNQAMNSSPVYYRDNLPPQRERSHEGISRSSSSALGDSDRRSSSSHHSQKRQVSPSSKPLYMLAQKKVPARVSDRLGNSMRYLKYSAKCNFPMFANGNSMLSRHLTLNIYERLYTKITVNGITLDRCIQPGVEESEKATFGLIAGDEDSYTVFAEIFNPMISEQHFGFGLSDKHPMPDLDANRLKNFNLDSNYVKYCCIKTGRNIRGLCFTPAMCRAERREVEKALTTSLENLTGDFKGRYYPLTNMSETFHQQLVKNHLIFEKPDRHMMVYSTSCRDWPDARGVWMNEKKNLLVWVNEEDHCRIVSIQQGGNMRDVFARFGRGLKEICLVMKRNGHQFMWNERLGYLCACPTNIGTGMKCCVNIQLYMLSRHPKFDAICLSLGLDKLVVDNIVQVVEISNAACLKKTEREFVQLVINGANRLIDMERRLENGLGIMDLLPPGVK